MHMYVHDCQIIFAGIQYLEKCSKYLHIYHTSFFDAFNILAEESMSVYSGYLFHACSMFNLRPFHVCSKSDSINAKSSLYKYNKESNESNKLRRRRKRRDNGSTQRAYTRQRCIHSLRRKVFILLLCSIFIREWLTSLEFLTH